MNKQEREYFDTCMLGLTDVLDYEKPLLIVSSGKSTLAYETIAMMAQHQNLYCELAMFRCEDGEKHEMVFVASRSHPLYPDRNLATYAIDLLFDAKSGIISRPRLQWELGILLGYSTDDRLNFIASKMSRECPCDCCGGPFVSEEIA